MCFEGTVQNDDAETYIQLEFLRKRNNNSIISRIISLENNAQNIALQINRGTTVTHHTEVVITEKTLGCWKSHRKKIESVERTEYSHFATMDVNARIPTRKYRIFSILFYVVRVVLHMVSRNLSETNIPSHGSRSCYLFFISKTSSGWWNAWHDKRCNI